MSTPTKENKRQNNRKFPLIIVLDNIRSAFNVGSVLRTADCAGAEEVITVGYTPVASHHKVKKTSLGAEKTVTTTHFDSLETAIQNLKQRGAEIYAIENEEDSADLWAAKLPENTEKPTAIIVGNEIEGVQLKITNKYGIKQLHIPMFGTKESLNVANATAIAIYDIIKRWKQA